MKILFITAMIVYLLDPVGSAHAESTSPVGALLDLRNLVQFCTNFNDKTPEERSQATREHSACVWYLAGVADTMNLEGKACIDLGKTSPNDLGEVLLRSLSKDVKEKIMPWPVPSGISAALYLEHSFSRELPCPRASR